MSIVLVPIGLVCVAAAAYHGYLGQTRLIEPATFPNRQAKALVGMIWQFSAAVWMVCGAVIALSPWLFDRQSLPLAVACACLPIGWGIIGNAWVTNGRHFGWKLFGAIVAAAIAGAFPP